MDLLNTLWKSILIPNSFESKLVYSLLALLALGLMRRLLVRVLQKKRDLQAQYQIRKTVGYISFGLGFLVVGRIWFTGFSSLTTYIGLLSAGLAVAMHAPLTNLAGWVFILFRKPFIVGDRVEIGPHRGDVIDQRLFMFSLMEVGNWVDADQSTGRIIHVPNGLLFKDGLANYTQGFSYIWNEIPILLTFESDWRRAKSILTEIAERRGATQVEKAKEQVKEANKQFMVFYSYLTPTVYTTVKDSGVQLTIRFLCAPRGRRGIEQEIWEDVLDTFAEHDDIDFAYPTQRLFANDREGKPWCLPAAPR